MSYHRFCFQLLIYVFFCISHAAYSQNEEDNIPLSAYNQEKVIPPTPKAQALLKFGEIPVDYSTGVPSISIPIYTLKSKDLELPIGISYHASNVKVETTPTGVGLGWSLNCGGVIGRTVLGKPDEQRNSVCFLCSQDIIDAVSDIEIDPTCNCYTDIINLELEFEQFQFQDRQSDRYAYSLPNGKSGVFRYDYLDDELIKIPYHPWKIERKINEDEDYVKNFTITDETGTKYLFEFLFSYDPDSYSDYYLTQITNANQTDSIIIEYGGSAFSTAAYGFEGSRSLFSASYNIVLSDPGCEFNLPYMPNVPSHSIGWSHNYDPAFIKSIYTTSGIQAHFNYSSNSSYPFGAPYSLDSINIYGGGKECMSVTLGHSSFGNRTENARLRLDDLLIEEKGMNGKGEKYAYEFKYNEEDLPDYSYYSAIEQDAHFNIDYWGYNNSSNSKGLIPGNFVSPDVFENKSGLDVGNRDPNKFESQSCLLKTIEYPTGGRTDFIFERHKVKDWISDIDNPVLHGEVYGGFRIKEIINYSSDSKIANRKYYEYEIPFAKKVTADFFVYTQKFMKYAPAGAGTGSCKATFERKVVVSEPLIPIAITDNNPVVYGKVIEYLKDERGNSLGKTEYYYEEPDCPTSDDNHPTHYEDARYINRYHYDRGLYIPRIKKKIIYKSVKYESTSNSNEYVFDPVKRIDYEYNELFSREFNTGIHFGRTISYISPLGWHYLNDYTNSFFALDTKAYEEATVLSKKTVYEYFQGEDSAFSIVNEYYYDDNTTLLEKQKIIKSNKDTLKVIYKYPYDFDVYPYTDMAANRNMLNYIVEKTTKINNKVTSSILTTYRSFDGKFLPNKVYQSEIGQQQPFEIGFDGVSAVGYGNEPLVSYSEYDNNGNPLKIVKRNGTKMDFLWSNYNHPVGKFINLPDGFFSQNLGVMKDVKELGSSRFYNPIDKNELSLQVQDIIGHIPSGTLFNGYTYDPFCGITSESNSNGVSSFFTYDFLGRLVDIRDFDGNILKLFDYSYENGQNSGDFNDLSVEVTGNSTVALGQQLMFQASVEGGSDNFSYAWVLYNNGSIVVDGNSPTFNYAPQQEGKYSLHFYVSDKVTEQTSSSIQNISVTKAFCRFTEIDPPNGTYNEGTNKVFHRTAKLISPWADFVTLSLRMEGTNVNENAMISIGDSTYSLNEPGQEIWIEIPIEGNTAIECSVELENGGDDNQVYITIESLKNNTSDISQSQKELSIPGPL